MSYSNKLFVSAGQSSSRISQITPSNSPAKVYTSLCVATPQVSKSAETKETPDTPSLQIEEGITVERSELCTTSKHSDSDPKLNPIREEDPSIPDRTGPTGTTTPLKSMGDASGRIPQEILEYFTQIGSSQFCHLGLDPLPNPEEEFNAESSTTMLPRQTEPTRHGNTGEKTLITRRLMWPPSLGQNIPISALPEKRYLSYQISSKEYHMNSLQENKVTLTSQ